MTPNVDIPVALKSLQSILEWNREIPQAVEACLHQIFQSRAEKQPQSPAICSWDGHLTYAELDSLSSRLAGHLVTQGVVPETVVPLLFEKSAWTIVSMLGVVKAGGAFVLLEPSQPVARLEVIVRQTKAKLALASAEYLSTCSSLVERVFVVDASSLFRLPLCQALPDVTPRNAAYIIFTSGSTGTPKGIIVEHAQLSTSAINCGVQLGFQDRPRVFQFASYVFDACLLEIVTTLVHGGVVCIPSEWERKNALVEAMRRMEITYAFFTPSLLSSLALEEISTLKTMVVGGEFVPPPLIEHWASRVRLILAYGPSECTVICFSSEASQHKAAPGEIGRAFGSRAWIVKEDNYNELAAIGETGELLIEGPILAREYLNDKEKTDKQFIQNPSWTIGIPTSHQTFRLYRTGDLAKYLEDGTVCFAGRIDTQVKIRGQRLELEDVEAQLHSYFAGQDAIKCDHIIVEAVILSGLTSKQLVTFLCLDSPESFGTLDWEVEDGTLVQTSDAEQNKLADLVSKITAKLQTVLPAYAVPSIYVPVRRFPIAITGKTDRKRLHSIVAPLSAKELAAFSTPSNLTTPAPAPSITPSERKLHELWIDVFGGSVAPDDNFFSLGGDSVLAIKLAAAARTSGWEISLETIFRNPILRDMARFMKSLTANGVNAAEIAPFSLLEGRDISQVKQQASKQCAISEDLIQDIYPCSPMQSGLFALSMKDPGAYVMQMLYRLPEDVDIHRLMTAWETAAERLQILRTRIFEYESELLQVVVDEGLRWEIVDGDLADVLAREKLRRLNLAEPLTWYSIVRLEETSECYLLVTAHHSLFDGWSAGLISTAVEKEYFEPDSTPVSGPKYNSWIRHVAKQDIEESKDFWRRELADAPAPSFPQLPYPGYLPHATAVLEHSVSAFKRDSLTTATILQAAWSLLIGTYSNSNDIVTGATLNGRTAQLAGVDKIPGPTITTVPFRTRWRPDQKLHDFLSEIRNHYLEIIPYEQFDLRKISRVSDDAEAACRFRSLLLVQTMNETERSRKLLMARRHQFSSLDFAITMECELKDKSIVFRATYDHQLLSDVVVRRMFKQMETLVHRLSFDSPGTKLADVQRICEADVAQIAQWNTPLSVPTPSYAHELVQVRAQEQPDTPAVCAWDGELNYAMLEQYSSQLASHLHTKFDICSGSLVVLFLEPSKWTPVAALAVLKAGGAFIPIDPNNSTERTQAIISSFEKNNIDLVLTSPLHAEHVGKLGLQILALEPEILDRLDGAGPICDKISPTNSACILFTSGSTGPPKAVLVEHKALCTGVLTYGTFTQVSCESRVLIHGPPASHISIGAMFATLIQGGCICVPSTNKGTYIGDDITSLNVNHANLTPTAANNLRPEDVLSLKVLAITGENLTPRIIETWANQVNLINLYSSAESGWATIGKLGIQSDESCCDIGRGIQALAWIVDSTNPNKLAPIGGVGELLIESSALAQGYFGDDTGTGTVFIDDPTFSKTKGSSVGRRFYLTGDLVCYNSDGSIDFVGRKDNQIELRGQRIVTEQIERHLAEAAAPSLEAAISVANRTNGSKAIVAFLVVEDKTVSRHGPEDLIARSPKSVDDFRAGMESIEARLKQHLPFYAVPQIYVPLRTLPLLPGGKVDRQRLQSLASSVTANQHSNLPVYTTQRSKPPSTRMEKCIHALWTTLFGTDQIGVDDNFFNLGGDSLVAMRLVSLARKEGVNMTVQGIFEAPTLRELALAVHETSGIAELEAYSLIRGLDITEVRRQAALQCGVGVERIEDMYAATTMQLHYLIGPKKSPTDARDFQGRLVFSLPRSIYLERFMEVWNSAVRRHPILRTRIVNTEHGAFQVVLNELEPPRWAKAASLEQYMRKDKYDNMGFGTRLLRFAIIQPENTRKRYFVLTTSHCIYDAFSLNMLFREVDAAYSDGFPDTSPPKMNHFIKYLIDADTTSATEFWTDYLDGAVMNTLLTVPDDCTVLQQTFTNRTIAIPKLHSSEITLSTMLEVAGGLALAHELACPDIILYSDRAGRNSPVEGIQDMVAPATLFIVVRIHADPAQKISDLLHDAQAAQVAMMPHEHLGFLELRKMPHLEDVLRPALNMNINPNGMGALGEAMGLEVTTADGSWDDPFGINVELKGENMELQLYSDDRFLAREIAERIVEHVEQVFLALVDAYSRPDLTVGEILESLK